MPQTKPAKYALRLIDTHLDIAERRGETRDSSYIVREMLLCTLPHRDPGDIPVWRREAYGAALMIQPGLNFEGKSKGIPYGPVARLLMYWIVTEVKRTGQCRLELKGNGENAHSLTAFLRELGKITDTGRGPRGDATRLKEQMQRLFAARIVLSRRSIQGRWLNEEYEEYSVTTKRHYWWDKETDEIGGAASIVVGSDMFEAIMKSVVPADIRALRALSYSPMAMDLYGLMNYFAGKREPTILRWEELQRRLGTGYKDLRDVRRAVMDHLPQIRGVHPSLRVEMPAEGGGIMVYPSATAIPRRQERYA